MVGQNKNLVSIAPKVIAPSFKSFNNNQKLWIISLILYFNKNYLPRKKCHWVLLINIARLRRILLAVIDHVVRKTLIQNHLVKYSINDKVQSICLNPDVIFGSKIMKYWYFNKIFLQMDKSFFSFGSNKICFKRIDFYNIQNYGLLFGLSQIFHLFGV